MINNFTYIIGAAIVGILHMSAPDHWLTLCVLAKNQQWTAKKLFRTSLLTAIGHVVLSVAIGLGVVAVGLVFSHLISSYLDTGIGVIMTAIGLIVGFRPFIEKRARHEHGLVHDHEHEDKKKNAANLSRRFGYFVILGAALSPDPSIVPIFLSAISAGLYFALELSIVFAIASIATLLLLVQLGRIGLAKTLARIPEKYNDSMVGFVIAVIGIYILVSG